jgi:hypothetical protein
MRKGMNAGAKILGRRPEDTRVRSSVRSIQIAPVRAAGIWALMRPVMGGDTAPSIPLLFIDGELESRSWFLC